MKVVVTGGGGRTGRLVVRKMAERKEFSVVATVRSEQAKADLCSSLNLSPSQVVVWDIASGSETEALKGAQGMVIVTSAVPEMVPPAPGAPPGPPTFVFKGGEAGVPEKVDWLGQKAQIDSAKAAGVKHVVVVGSMGGTDPNHMLNKIGGGGNILQWKRKAEQYLMQSGLTYTIIHPGGLLDEEGGQRQLLLGVDDKLSTQLHGNADKPFRTIPRADVAELCIQSLLLPSAQNRAFDATSMPPGEGGVTTDFAGLFESLEGKNCDYTINSQWD